jgi:signal peptidase II
MTPKLLVGWSAFLSSLLLDQTTKILVDQNLSYADRVEMIEGFFYLTHVRNPGAAFGLFNEGPAAIRLTFFISISLVAIAIVLSFFRKLAPGDRLSALALGCILGGAVGNLIDRIRVGRVTDFVDFFGFPTFNVADSSITIGVTTIVIGYLLFAEKQIESRAPPEPPHEDAPADG